MNAADLDKILSLPLPNFEDSDEIYASLLSAAEDPPLQTPTFDPVEAGLIANIPSSGLRRHDVRLSSHDESLESNALLDNIAYGPTGPSPHRPVLPLPSRPNLDLHRPRRPLLPGQSAMRLDSTGPRVLSSACFEASVATDCPGPTCQCSEKTRKPLRHWRTACPYNPDLQRIRCTSCGRPFTRKDNCLRHTKGCRVEAQS